MQGCRRGEKEGLLGIGIASRAFESGSPLRRSAVDVDNTYKGFKTFISAQRAQ